MYQLVTVQYVLLSISDCSVRAVMMMMMMIIIVVMVGMYAHVYVTGSWTGGIYKFHRG